MDCTDITKWTDEDLQEYYERFIELERYKLAERVKKEMDRRKYGKQSNS